MNVKTSLVSAFAALFLSTIAVGTAIVPATVAGVIPAAASIHA